MYEEIRSIYKNDNWELTNIPKNQNTIGVQLVYKTKLKDNNEVGKFKAILVEKGYNQDYGVDYVEVFAPIARLNTLVFVISLVAQNAWKIYQLNVKFSFIHVELQEKVFIKQPLGYVKFCGENRVLRLKKALYGLKQDPRDWYNHINTHFSKQ